MRDYQLREQAELWPHRCFLTETGSGPFVDTFIDREEYGRIYVSMRALEWMAPLGGYVPQALLDEATEELARVREYVRELESQLEEERSPEGKVVSVADFMEYLARHSAPDTDPVAA